MRAKPFAEYQMLKNEPYFPDLLLGRTYLFRRGCSRRVHHIDTMIIIVGLIEASNAPRIKRKTMSPANPLKAAQIMHEMAHPKKQNVIHRFTGNRTNA
jgi:hypothetical protein